MNYLVLILFGLFLRSAEPLAPSNDPSGEKLCFDIKENDMEWPITDPGNILFGTIHGVHCSQLTEQFLDLPPTSSLEQMHYEHCRRMVVAMFDRLQNEPSVYIVSDTICYDMLKDSQKKKRSNGFLASYYNKVDSTSAIYKTFNSYMGPTVNNRRKKKSLDDNRSGNEQSKIDVQNKWYNKIKQRSSNQMELFYNIGGMNFGHILWKGYFNDTSFTHAERHYYHSLESTPNVRFGTLGVVCSHKGNITAATLALENLIIDTSSIPIGPMAPNFSE